MSSTSIQDPNEARVFSGGVVSVAERCGPEMGTVRVLPHVSNCREAEFRTTSGHPILPPVRTDRERWSWLPDNALQRKPGLLFQDRVGFLHSCSLPGACLLDNINRLNPDEWDSLRLMTAILILRNWRRCKSGYCRLVVGYIATLLMLALMRARFHALLVGACYSALNRTGEQVTPTTTQT